MIKQYKLRFYNFKLVILLTAISLFGVQLVASASPDLRNKQLLGVVMGLVLLVILSLMDYSWILNFQWIMYGFNLLMLIGVRLFGSEAGGASRWLDIGGFRFQPTELSKVIIILFFAKFFMDHEDDINTFRVLAESVLLLAVPLALIYAQPDMKNTITVTIIFCILLYIAGLSYKIIGGAILIAVPLLIIFLSIVVQPDQTLIKDYQRTRIMSFLYPENEEYQGQGSGREDYLLRNWQCGSYTEFFEYLRCYWTGTEYWYASSFCKLWSDFPGQLVYRYGACDECRSAEQYL